ncbi:MAG: hypothetical protein FWE54_01525 [Methanimicrococcus sp.]|nr:hypothetical protein [Methanimicrococcus sp.]
MSVGQDLLDVPFGDMVLQLALAIAQGQFEMDKVCCEIAKMMGTEEIKLTNVSTGKEVKTTLLGAGFQPTFYQFTDTIIEVKMAISMQKSTDANVNVKTKAGFGVFSASVNASYSSKYSYSVDGSSLLRTKITPLPPNPTLQGLIGLKSESAVGSSTESSSGTSTEST